MAGKPGDTRIGISGWRYAPRRGKFDPEGLAQRQVLAFASRMLPTIGTGARWRIHGAARPAARLDEQEKVMIAVKNACLGALLLSLGLAAQAGAWGDGALDNDAAQEWLAQCAETGDATLVPQALEMALVASYVDADDGAVAVAAAELIAHALDRGRAAGRTAVAPCLASTPPAELRAMAPRARQALARIADPETSELAQLWSDDPRNRGADTLRRLAVRLQR